MYLILFDILTKIIYIIFHTVCKTVSLYYTVSSSKKNYFLIHLNVKSLISFTFNLIFNKQKSKSKKLKWSTKLKISDPAEFILKSKGVIS